MDQQILMNHLNLQIGQKWTILQKYISLSDIVFIETNTINLLR